MNIKVATCSPASIPVLVHLQKQGYLKQVLIPKKEKHMVSSFEQIVPKSLIKVISLDESANLELSTETDKLISFGFPYRISDLGGKGLNVHFGALPENRGPDPLFWTLKQGKREAHITVHEISSEIDAGEILSQQSYKIAPGETYGLLTSRLANLAVEQISRTLKKPDRVKPQNLKKAQYYHRPTENDITIDWQNMSSLEIEHLVNACNPTKNGASTSLKGTKIKLIEVISPQQYNLGLEYINVIPGTIIQANEQGIAVKCCDNKPLFIIIAALQEGIFSASRFINFGVKKGTMFK